MAEFKPWEHIPDHTTSEEVDALLEAFQEILWEDNKDTIESFRSIKDPREFPFEFQPLYEGYLDYPTPQLPGQTEEDIRRQYERIFDWVPLKSTLRGVRSFLYSLGFDIEPEPLVTDDYQDFRPASDGPLQAGEFYTPHVLLDFGHLDSIDGELMTQEIFDVLTFRLERLYSAWIVPHHRFSFNGVVEEYDNVLEQNEVEGVALDRFQVEPPVKAEFCVENEFPCLRDYQYMDTEFIESVDVGTLDTNTTLDASINSLDNVLYSKSDVDVELRQADGNTRLLADIYDQGFQGQTFNSLLFRDVGGDPMIVLRFPPVEIIDAQFIDIRNVTRVLKSPPKRIESNFNEQEAFGETDNGVKTWLTDNYDLTFDEEPNASHHILSDNGVTFDTNFSIPDAVNISQNNNFDQRGYWKAGNLDGTTSGSEPSTSGGDIWNPVMDLCKDFEWDIRNRATQWQMRIPLNHASDLYGETIEQIGVFDEQGNLMIVIEWPDSGFVVSDYSDRSQCRIRMNLRQNQGIFST
jgi:hypothetical protein